MDNEYGKMFKRLMNERNELRKYIIDICKLLDIDTNSSVLGANCLEFYAVLCSTVNNKIKDLQQQLKRTGQRLQAEEQECETQRYKLNYYIKKTTQLLDDIDNYKQAFDEIENIAGDYNRVEKTSQYYRDGFDQIQGIINNIKDSK